MANADNAAPRSSLGWLSKLVLWGVVIAFGYLYLSSIDREAGTPTKDAFMESLAKLSPIPIDVLPSSSKEEASEPVVAEESTSPAVEESPQADSVRHEPVRQAESSVFANSLIRQQPVAPAPAPAPVAAQPSQRAVAPAPAVSAPRMMPQPVAPAPAPAVAAAPSQAAPAESAPAQPMPAASAPYDWETLNKQRAEVMAQYESMRREAEERMRQQWEQMRSYAPPAPYAYPGYAPSYPPAGYAPAR